MLNLQIPQEMLKKVHSIANDYGFPSSEEFVHYVLKELLEAIRNKDFTAGGSERSKKEQDIMRAKLQDLGYM